MRIAIVTDAWRPQINGVVRTLETVSRLLRDWGHEVEVFGPDRFRTLPCPTYPEIRLSLLPYGRLKHMLSAYRPDAIHVVTEGPLGWAARRFCRKRGIPFTTAYHTRFPEYVKLRTGIPLSWSYALVRRFHAPSSAVLVVSPAIRQELAARGFRKLAPWSRGVDISAFKPMPREDTGEARPIWLYAGRVAIEKNIEAFLDLDLPGTKWVVGGGPQLARLRSRYPHARFFGSVETDELSYRYAQSDCFVFPSVTDTFGLVMVEALASGVPVAGYPVPGPLDVVTDPRVGALDGDLRLACLGAVGRDPRDCRSHAESFTWERCARQLLGAFHPIPRSRWQSVPGGRRRGCRHFLTNDEASPAMTLSDRLFARLFRGLVYTQIWEDPEIDMEALQLGPDSRVMTIASGGCNVMSYLVADPAQITALDLSPAHVALLRLKLVAARHLPDWETFHRFLGEADAPENVDLYDSVLAPHLDAASRAWWEGRSLHRLGQRRISIFARNAYRHGVLGRFIGLTHATARLHGVRLRDLLEARSLEEQRRFFETVLAPLFDRPAVRWATTSPLSLYGLGIPPAQYEALAGGRAMGNVLRERVERLACGFPLQDNWFAWQAFGRSYAEGDGPRPPYLRRGNFDVVRSRADRVVVINRNMIDHLATCPAGHYDRYVLLDAQDWMDDATLNALWQEITRTAMPGARVIFRTAAEPSLLPGRLEPGLLARWDYAEDLSRDLARRDRSAIYGGFHLYVRSGR